MKVSKFLKLMKRQAFRARYIYARFYESTPAPNDEIVLFQAFDGKSFGGNPFYILKEMQTDAFFRPKRKFIAVNENVLNTVKKMVELYAFDNTEVILVHSRRYCKLLASAKYLINNSTFPTYFIKKPCQVYLNTWHGTPLKTMGRKMADRPHATGNTQRNFLMADYLLYPNEYMFDRFRTDYMIEPFYSGTYVLSGYPCNSVFFDANRRTQLRKALGLEGKHIVAYMPTWRTASAEPHALMQNNLLTAFAEYLSDDSIVLAKPHYYEQAHADSMPFNDKVRPFPGGYETYDILNLADVLVTDYSSVMFDYLNLNCEIVLFDYDKDEYFETRGAYFAVEDLPFFQTGDAGALCRHLNDTFIHGFDHSLYTEIKQRFCTWDNGKSAQAMCSLLKNGTGAQGRTIEGTAYHNGKPNCMIFCGALQKNGITTSLLGLMENIDYDERNYLFTFTSSNGKKAMQTINSFDERINYYPLQGRKALTLTENLSTYLYYHRHNPNGLILKKFQKVFDRDAKRLFPNLTIDSYIHFTGYERNQIHLMLGAEVGNRIVYVHNDMAQENSLKGNFHLPSIKRCYQNYDKIAIVRSSLKDVLVNHFSVPESKIYTVHNFNRINYIRESANKQPQFEKNTNSSMPLDELMTILEDDSIAKFVNVGRFSPEKGQDRLIRAFERYSVSNQKSILIIIGGLGKDFKAIRNQANESPADIVVIRSLNNPLPIVARCNAFVLASHYEGLPMSIMEALALDLPVICTNIPGPRELLEQGYGYLVEDSEEGIYEGLIAFSEGRIPAAKQFAFDQFNKQALSDFNRLFQ